MRVTRYILLLFIVAVAIAEDEEYSYGAGVCPKKNFDAEADAEILEKAIKSLNVTEIIILLTERVNDQRVKIARSYKDIYNVTLMDEFKRILRGNIRDLVVALMTPSVDYLVQELLSAIWYSIGPDEEIMNELLCDQSMNSTREIMKVYKEKYNRSLESDLKIDGPKISLRRLLAFRIVFQSERDRYVEAEQEELDARQLYDTHLSKLMSDDDSQLNDSILVTRRSINLRETFDRYEHVWEHGFEEMIHQELKDDVANSIIPFVKCVRDHYSLFVDRLYANLTASSGTNHRSLIRIIVSRSEMDILNIRRHFNERYPNNKLDHMITERTPSASHYRYGLLSLISEKWCPL